MTISTRRRLLLRHGAGKRTRSTLSSGNGADLASNARHFRQNSRSVLKLGQDFGMMAASEAANGKSRMKERAVDPAPDFGIMCNNSILEEEPSCGENYLPLLWCWS